jgi:lipopolysaccharide heptosyltransferase II
MRKILIFNVNWLGDVIFSSPFIRAIREAFPNSYIACAAPPRCKDILETNIRINELIIFDENGQQSSFIGKINFAFKLRREKFDMAFILHRSLTRALLMFIAGINERVGYDTKRRSFFLTKKLTSTTDSTHRVEYFLELARAIGADVSKKDYEFFITATDRKQAYRILEANGVDYNDRIVVLNPGGNWIPKRWPVDKFAQLANRLMEKYDVKILITGSEKDKVLARDITRDTKNKPISICGQTTIRELASILEMAKLMISGDSGPMHIGVAVGTNVVALFGPTSADITGPYGKGSYTVLKKDVGCTIPCYDFTCKDNRCMKAISVDDIMTIIEEKGYLK